MNDDDDAEFTFPYSPDGSHLWDGHKWVPVRQAPQAHMSGQPQQAGTPLVVIVPQEKKRSPLRTFLAVGGLLLGLASVLLIARPASQALTSLSGLTGALTGATNGTADQNGTTGLEGIPGLEALGDLSQIPGLSELLGPDGLDPSTLPNMLPGGAVAQMPVARTDVERQIVAAAGTLEQHKATFREYLTEADFNAFGFTAPEGGELFIVYYTGGQPSTAAEADRYVICAYSAADPESVVYESGTSEWAAVDPSSQRCEGTGIPKMAQVRIG